MSKPKTITAQVWVHSSTGSVREIIDRFVESVSDDRRKVDPETIRTIEGGGGKGILRAEFKLIDGIKTYEIVGRPPGEWTVSEKTTS